MNYSNRGGRPKSTKDKKRSRQVNIKFNSMEFLILTIRAGNAKMKIPDYVRNCIAQSEVIARLSVSENNIIRELINMGNNLNQIAKKANQAGYDGVSKIYFDLAAKIDNVITRFRDGGKDNS